MRSLRSVRDNERFRSIYRRIVGRLSAVGRLIIDNGICDTVKKRSHVPDCDTVDSAIDRLSSSREELPGTVAPVFTDSRSRSTRIAMTEKSSRRTFVKGVAATTSLAALGGQAAAQGQSGQGQRGQGQGGQPTIEDIQSDVTANQAGQGLVVLQVGGVSLNALNANNVQLFFNDELIDISDVEILTAGDDLVQIVVQDSLNDLIDIFGNTVNATVSILGGAVTESEQLSLGQQ